MITLTPTRTAFLPYCLPSIGEEEIAEVVDSLRSGWITTGPKTKRFEAAFAAYTGARHAIAVNSCTAALHLSLAAHDIGPGDEVIVPTLTFCSTANVVEHLGATPVLVDVDEDGLVTATAIANAITAKTRAIIPVHYAGQSVDLDPILDLARHHQIPVIEDAAHAAGTHYKGRQIGTHGCAVCFSFYATKNMTTGEGGIVTTNDDDLAARLRLLALHGMSRDAWNRYTASGSWFYEVIEPGYKDNMTDIQAALGLHQLAKLETFIAQRRAMADRYANALRNLPGIILPKEIQPSTPPAPTSDASRHARSEAKPSQGSARANEGLADQTTHPSAPNRHTWHLYPIQLTRFDRALFIDALKERNIGASVHFIPVHRHPFYRDRYGYLPSQFPSAEQLYAGMVSLPLYPKMTEADEQDVLNAVREILS